MKEGLHYIIAYLLWFVVLALGLWCFLIGREVVLEMLSGYAEGTTRQAGLYRFIDKLYVLLAGMTWLVLALAIEDYFRRGIQRYSLMVSHQ